jgi:hypothetical protein
LVNRHDLQPRGRLDGNLTQIFGAGVVNADLQINLICAPQPMIAERPSVTRHKDPLFGTDRHIEGGTPVLGRAGGAVRGPGY